jgi:hypothetical protein
MMKKLPKVFTRFALALVGAQAIAQPASIPGALPGIQVPAQPNPAQPPSIEPTTGAPVQVNPETVAQPQPQIPRGPLSFDDALTLLTDGGFTARPHYNGVPDSIARRVFVSRDSHLQKLRNIVIPVLGNIDNYNLTEMSVVLNALIKQHDPEKVYDPEANDGKGGWVGVGVNIIINQYLTPGAPSNQQGGGQQGGGQQGGGSGGVDPETGLPLNPGGGMMGGEGEETIDPITGLPLNPGGGGQGGGQQGGGQQGGAQLPGLEGLAGVGGQQGGDGLAGGGLQPKFDPEAVKVKGLNCVLQNLSAKQVLDIVSMSFDHPIQYVIMDQGVIFMQKPASQQGYFTRTFRLNPSAVLGFPGQGGGGQGGGGQGGVQVDPQTGLPVGGGQGGGPDESGGGMGDPGGGQGGPVGFGPAPSRGGAPRIVPGGGRGAPQLRQFNRGGYNGSGYNGRGFQQGNRFNTQSFSQQNFGGYTGFQRFNSFTRGYGQ